MTNEDVEWLWSTSRTV